MFCYHDWVIYNCELGKRHYALLAMLFLSSMALLIYGMAIGSSLLLVGFILMWGTVGFLGYVVNTIADQKGMVAFGHMDASCAKCGAHRYEYTDLINKRLRARDNRAETKKALKNDWGNKKKLWEKAKA